MSLGSRFSDAVAYADAIHQGQVRKGTRTPYISHLLATASAVIQCGGDEDVAIAALLHDALEDQPGRTSLESIRELFGSGVARLVEAVTEPPKTASWQARKDAYERQLAKAPDDAVLVSLADKAHNLQSLVDDLQTVGQDVWSRFNAGPAACLARYGRLLELYKHRLGDRGGAKALLQRMHRELALAQELALA